MVLSPRYSLLAVYRNPPGEGKKKAALFSPGAKHREDLDCLGWLSLKFGLV